MKKISYFLFATMLFLSCEDKHDCNGLLDGNWQLTEWRNISNDSVVADNNALIFYTVKLQLMQFKAGVGNIYLSHFKHTGDSLILLDSYLNYANSDSIVPFTAFDYLGVPADGKFRVTKLTNDNLQLTTPTHTLTFRRY